MTSVYDIPPNHNFKFNDHFFAFSQELKALAAAHSNLNILQLGILKSCVCTLGYINHNHCSSSADVTAFDSYPQVVAQIQDVVGDNGLNMLINNAGYACKSTRLDFVKDEDMEHTFRVNVVAPVMLSRAMSPLLKSAASSDRPSWIVNMSSVLGSIQANVDGAMYPYRASKSALNACTKSMSIDLRRDHVHAISLHPGWVKTDMGGRNAQLEVEDSCGDMVRLVTALTPDKNGKFLQHDGKELDW